MKKLSISILLSAMLLTFGAYAKTCTVVPGDNMTIIAKRYQCSLKDLLAANPQVKNPSTIKPGQKLALPSTTDMTILEKEVVRLVNVERSKRGLATLKANAQLGKVARLKSQDMVNKGYFAHNSPTYGSPFKMMESFGIRYTAAGENIAKGQRTAQEVMTGWMNSPGHRSNILSTSFSEIGVGCATNKSGVKYWTQQFIRPAR